MIEEYLSYLTQVKKVSPNTLESYRRDILKYHDYMTKVQKKVPHFRPPTWLHMKYYICRMQIFLIICLVGASVVSFLTLINIQNFLKVSTFNRKKVKKRFSNGQDLFTFSKNLCIFITGAANT